MYDVVALGELLIDFIQNGNSSNGNPVFEANPGGAPCNVLSMLTGLGYKTAFIGKVGDDYFGKMLGNTIKRIGISDKGLIYDKEVNTTLAIVHTMEDGDRDFSFYRKPGADIMLDEKDVCKELIENCRIFHFGSLSLTDEPAATATKAAVTYAKQMGRWISFDPNLRKTLWNDLEHAKTAIWYGIQECDILKIADDEIEWLTGTNDYDQGVRIIRKQSKAKMINVTFGKKGSISYYCNEKVFGKPFLSKATVDTTGAGDTFCANVLGFVLDHGLDNLGKKQLEQMLLFANAAASIVTTRKGAICSMPKKEEILFHAERTDSIDGNGCSDTCHRRIYDKSSLGNDRYVPSEGNRNHQQIPSERSGRRSRRPGRHGTGPVHCRYGILQCRTWNRSFHGTYIGSSL